MNFLLDTPRYSNIFVTYRLLYKELLKLINTTLQYLPNESW